MKNSRKEKRLKRKRRIRVYVVGTAERPRVAVYKSNQKMSVQVIDDAKAVTILGARGEGKSITQATKVGESLAQMLKTSKITKIVFDRGGYRYHGAVKALADTLRKGGIEF